MLVLKFVSPLYTAVMECVPTAKDEVVNIAWPLPFNVPDPSTFVPSLKVTVPVGVPVVDDFTVAVNVTFWLSSEGLSEDWRLTLVRIGARRVTI